jgi:hypothetical protein
MRQVHSMLLKLSSFDVVRPHNHYCQLTVSPPAETNTPSTVCLNPRIRKQQRSRDIHLLLRDDGCWPCSKAEVGVSTELC